jgi:hypothetical protein
MLCVFFNSAQYCQGYLKILSAGLAKTLGLLMKASFSDRYFIAAFCYQLCHLGEPNVSFNMEKRDLKNSVPEKKL